MTNDECKHKRDAKGHFAKSENKKLNAVRDNKDESKDGKKFGFTASDKTAEDVLVSMVTDNILHPIKMEILNCEWARKCAREKTISLVTGFCGGILLSAVIVTVLCIIFCR